MAFLLTDLATARHEDERIARSLHVDGVVEPGYRGGREIPVTYDNEVTGQRITATAYPVTLTVPEPRAGLPVALDVSRDNPGVVFLARDRRTWWSNLAAYGWLPLLPLAVVLLRLLRLRRVEWLLRNPGPTFAMLGSLHPPRRFAKRCDLGLHALDARPGAKPLCSLPVVTTGGAPVGEFGFRVEVKGSPRPGGTVVARAGEEVLWPAGPAYLRARGGRPDRIVDREPEDPGLSRSPSLWHREIPRVSWARTAAWPLLTLAGLAVLLAVTTLVTWSNRDDVERIDREGIEVLATLRDVNGSSSSVRLSYRLPGTDRDRLANVEVDRPEAFHVGWRYPLRVDREHPEDVHLLARPYDAAAPIGFVAVLAGIAAIVVGRRVAWWLAIFRVGRRGPWRAVDAWHLASREGDRVVALAMPGGRQVRCTVRLPERQATAALAVDRGWPVRIEAAGRLEPGEPVALRAGGRRLTVARLAGADVGS